MSEENKNNSGEFSPFEANVKSREYTKITEDPTIMDIPEAIFTPPSVEDLTSGLRNKVEDSELGGPTREKPVENSNSSSAGNSNQFQQKTQPQTYQANPALSDLDAAEKRKAAKAAVEAALDGYGKLNAFASKAVEFPIRKVEKMHNKGEINKNLALDIDGQPVPIIGFMHQYNQTMQGIFAVSEEWKDKVRPVAVEVFMKYNIGLSAEGQLLYYLGTDISTKMVIGYQLRQTMGDMLEQFIAMSQVPGNQNVYGTQTTSTASQETRKPEPNNPPPTTSGNDSGTAEGKSGSKIKSEATGREFVEPEEINRNKNEETEYQQPIHQENVASGNNSSKVKAEEPVVIKPKSKKMPTFGDKTILKDMENVAKKSRKK